MDKLSKCWNNKITSEGLWSGIYADEDIIADYAKVFGYGLFECECGREWISAYSSALYKQGCFTCNRFSLPIGMWLRCCNDKFIYEKKNSLVHDKDRCEACMKGVKH